MTQTVTHFIGPPVAMDGRLIQRCAICGEKLLDIFMPKSGDGANGKVAYVSVWPVGEYLHYSGVDGEDPSLMAKISGHELPADCCISLVE